MISKFIQQHEETRLAEVFKIMESALNILTQSRTFPEVDESSYQTLFRKNRIRSKYFTLLTGHLQKLEITILKSRVLMKGYIIGQELTCA